MIKQILKFINQGYVLIREVQEKNTKLAMLEAQHTVALILTGKKKKVTYHK